MEDSRQKCRDRDVKSSFAYVCIKTRVCNIVCKSTQLRSLGILTDTANCMFLQTLSYDVYMNGVLSSLLTIASKHA